ncbi:hypothetical protein LTR08_002176 [Meristemomyces frigidus]|nr:hypothetical protein LTR08_002176 [Meristemomyces frigidus]
MCLTEAASGTEDLGHLSTRKDRVELSSMLKRKASSPAAATAPPAAKKRNIKPSSHPDAPSRGSSVGKGTRSRTGIIEEVNALSGPDFNNRYLKPDGLFNSRKENSTFNSLAADLPPSNLDACFDLIEATSRADYEASSQGWHPRRKRREMTEPEMRYLLATEPADIAGGQPTGFLSYMLTHDSVPSVPVLYIYEIHLKEAARGRGLGRWFMALAEEIAASVGVEKVMLTCFVRNTKARRFYQRLGYETDECSPADRKTRMRVVRADYVIMSKRVGS